MTRLLRVRDVAQRLDVSTTTVYALVAEGLPHLRVGRSIRVPDDALSLWVERHTQQAQS